MHQLSQAEKDSVPEDVRKAAREMGEKAFKDRWAWPTNHSTVAPSLTSHSKTGSMLLVENKSA